MIEFTIPIKVDDTLSLNSIYSGAHWSGRKKLAEDIHNMVRFSLISQHIPKKIFSKPVDITFFWNSNLDLDNHGYLCKIIIDGLKNYIIYDDSKKYVKSITHKYWDENGVHVSIS